MNTPFSSTRRHWRPLTGGLAALALLVSVAAAKPSPEEAPGFLYRTNYHGWADSIWMSNGKVEAIIVPQVARIMQFRLAGEKDGPFWENPALLGKPAAGAVGEWQNFGGDKVWPAPQKQWGDIAPTNWPPPVGFDGTPAQAEVDGWVVTLRQPADPSFGIAVTRRIELDVRKPAMHVQTTYEKVKGLTLDASIWTVTQVKAPIAVYTRVPSDTRYGLQFQLMSDRRPPSLEIRKGILSVTAESTADHKIGVDSGTLIWMGPDYLLRIDSPRRLYADYPDNGASAEISINADPRHMGLEMLGPLVQMRVGHKISRNSTYTLLRRTERDPVMEVRRQLPE